MRLSTRKLLDKTFSGIGIIAISLMILALLVILVPIFSKGATAVLFKATVEHRRLLVEQFGRNNKIAVDKEMKEVMNSRQPVYDMIKTYKKSISSVYDSVIPVLETIGKRNDRVGHIIKRRLKRFYKSEEPEDKQRILEQSYNCLSDNIFKDDLKQQAEVIKVTLDSVAKQSESFNEINEALHDLLGPFPREQIHVLIRKQYGQTRWDRSQIKLKEVLYSEKWDYSDKSSIGKKVMVPRIETFRGTALEPLFGYMKENIQAMMHPRMTFYTGFFLDSSKDSHMFGGIMPELLGTLYLTIGAMLFALPMGIISAIYFTEYAGVNAVVNMLRICVSTLAGVPSIVFGLFGLAFFINTVHMPKSVLAGSLTLALLILPTIIRASEEAILAVPNTYREAALALGAGKWHTITSVVLPVALPGILTGSVISMGRAAGETAPIIFTAAVSVGKALTPANALFQPTPALSWNIYNLCTEHEAVDEIRHVQFGMVATLILVVLILNAIAVFMRARISNKLKG